MRDFFDTNRSASFIGHNILKFDAPVLNRLAGTKIRVSSCIDTLVLSMLYSPNMPGGHSLDAWGERLKRLKIDFKDFKTLTPEMVEYCHQDVAITGELFIRLMRTLAGIGFSEKAIDIQHKFTAILGRQQKNGFKFDGPRAINFYAELRKMEEDLAQKVREVFPAEKVFIAERAMCKKDGSPTAIYLGGS